jgi:hypothetical protein
VSARARSRSQGGTEIPPTPRPGLERWILLLAVILALLLYLRSPIDLVPDRLGGIGLVDDLVVMIVVLVWVRRRFRIAAPPQETMRRPAPRARGGDGVPAWDPYRVLGVPRGAGAEEITRAYREQMKRYHPDRVADLGEELRALAHEKSLAIQRAYQELVPRKG